MALYIPGKAMQPLDSLSWSQCKETDIHFAKMISTPLENTSYAEALQLPNIHQ